jgi:hypothetical protein
VGDDVREVDTLLPVGAVAFGAVDRGEQQLVGKRLKASQLTPVRCLPTSRRRLPRWWLT